MSTFLLVGGQPLVDVGVPVLTYLDDPSIDGHQQGAYTPYRGLGRSGVEGLRRHVRQLALHHDATLSSRACVAVLKRRALSTHLLIDNDGSLLQMLDLAHGAWHAGRINPYSIGLDLSNAASVQYASRYRDRGIFQGDINGETITALGYADAQYETLIAVIRAVSKFFPRVRPQPPLDAEGQVINRAIGEVEKFEGVLAHFHVTAHKWDPGPGLDWKRVFDAVHGGGFHFPLSLTVGGGGGDVGGARFDDTAQRFYAINEGHPYGGWYPVGVNGAWHSGVHLPVDQGARVNAMLDGEVIAARFGPPSELGSANFVLVKHGQKIAGVEQTFFSLVMHLDEVDLGRAGTGIAWLDRARARAGAPPPGNDSLDLSALDADDEPSIEALRPGHVTGVHGLGSGKVSVLSPPEPVQSGELLGYAGFYGSDALATAQVDVSLFGSSQFLPLGDFKNDFEELSPDDNGDAFCDIDEVLRAVDRGYRRGGPLSSEAVAAFFAGRSERVRFRGFIARHISEWWSETDWRSTIERRAVWSWNAGNRVEAFLRRIAPFQWYTPALAKLLGLPADGVVVTYHPIRFLKWLAQTQAGAMPRATAVGLTDGELEKAREAEEEGQAAGSWLQSSSDGTELLEEQLEDLDSLDWKEQGPGEWPPVEGYEFLEEED